MQNSLLLLVQSSSLGIRKLFFTEGNKKRNEVQEFHQIHVSPIDIVIDISLEFRLSSSYNDHFH